MITSFLWPHLQAIDSERMWFQQDFATCHTSRDTIALLREKFPGRVLSRNGDQNWPPRSCDLTPCDYFLWGYLKSHVYANKPRTVQELREEIQRFISYIDRQMCERVIMHFIERVR